MTQLDYPLSIFSFTLYHISYLTFSLANIKDPALNPLALYLFLITLKTARYNL